MSEVPGYLRLLADKLESGEWELRKMSYANDMEEIEPVGGWRRRRPTGIRTYTIEIEKRSGMCSEDE